MNANRPELGAVLDHVCLRSEDPERLAGFLELAYGMRKEKLGEAWKCSAPQRTLLVVKGRANTVAYFAYAFESPERLEQHRKRITAKVTDSPSSLFDESAIACVDADGNTVVFGHRDPRSGPLLSDPCPRGDPGERENGFSPSPLGEGRGEGLPARLQHLALRTPDVDAMAAFYQSLGFVVSDRVQCEEGVLRACFMRTDAEHHALALFRASEARFDHLSCETTDTTAVIAWADRMAQHRIAIHWGVGRHGPGNDVFFMVKDPDGNLMEISAELEVCEPAREPGTWRHEQRTLNLWGNAIMRS